MRRAAWIAGALMGFTVLSTGTAVAHPLGNFTVNRYDGVVVASDRISVDHVEDLAEIPTLQATSLIDGDGDRQLSDSERASWAARSCGAVAGAVRVSVGDARVPLKVSSAAATVAPGQGGLSVLRLTCALDGPLVPATGRASVSVVNSQSPGQVGWRELTVRGDRMKVMDANVPATSVSARLTAYPADLLTSPLDQRSATFDVVPGGPALDRSPTATAASPLVTGGLTGALTGLVTGHEATLPWVIVAFIVAMALGAGHALAPGHGKTMMAFYLSDRRRGSWRSAATVGLAVTLTHTAGVLALGLLVGLTTAFAPASIYPWLTAGTGVVVGIVGLVLLKSAGRRRDHGHSHGLGGRHTHPHLTEHAPHDHDDASHHHDHVPHDHDHASHHSVAHQHAPASDREAAVVLSGAMAVPATAQERLVLPSGTVTSEAQRSDAEAARASLAHGAAPVPPRQAGLVAMGVAGGLVPSPSALIVLLSAVALGRTWLGVVLVVAFGAGMAISLCAVGLLVLRMRVRLEAVADRPNAHRMARVVSAMPIAVALGLVALGVFTALKGLSSV